MEKETKKTAEAVKYTKAQIVSSGLYARYSDFLSGNLKDGNLYSKDQINRMIETFYRKGVK